MKHPDSLMYNIFNDLKYNENVNTRNTWAVSVKNLLYVFGFGCFWNPETNFANVKIKTTRSIFTRME